MALGVLKRKKKSILLMILAATIAIVVAIVVLWLNGAFLPSWIEWKNVSVNKGLLKNGVKVQDALNADIDHDGEEELLVLCWRIGRYGDRKPFWVTHDELKWSQHIYIYEKNDKEESGYKAKWMASDIHTFVKCWEVFDEGLIKTVDPDGNGNIWVWNSWGLERLPEEGVKDFIEKRNTFKEQKENEESVEEEEAEEQEKTKEGESDNNEYAESDSVSIIMVGDILLHDGVTASCKKDDGTYDFSSLFVNTADVISEADIAIVNQEVIIGGADLRISGYPAFNAPYEIGDALYDAGFDVVCHGTNHALDRNKKGIVNCLDYWKENHPDMAVLGIHDSEEDASEIYIRDMDGFKIAILNYTYGTNGIPMPDGMPYAVDIINKDKIASDLAWAEENADFTIVCPHWGVEYQLKENSEQDSLAAFMADNGADLIIGTHPHVIEPVKWVETENGSRALCYYSLGNFVNWTSGRGANVANRMVGGMARIYLNRPENEGGLSDADLINDFEVLPLVSHVEHTKGAVTTYFLEDYTEDCAEKNAIREQDSSFDLDYCYKLCSEVWGDLPQYLVEGR